MLFLSEFVFLKKGFVYLIVFLCNFTIVPHMGQQKIKFIFQNVSAMSVGFPFVSRKVSGTR